MRCSSETLKTMRERAGYTQEILATKAGIDVRTLQRAEAGQNIGIETCAQIAAALNADISDLVVNEIDASPEKSTVAQLPVVASSSTALTKRDFIFRSISLASAVFGGTGAFFGGMNYCENIINRREREESNAQEVREMAFRLLFGESDKQYYIPSINNPYSRISGITLPTRDAMRSILDRFGFTERRVHLVDNPCTSLVDGSLMLFGGPVANIFSRQIFGVGRGSPFFSRVHGKRVDLPISFDGVLPSMNVGPGLRPDYQFVVNGQRHDGLERPDCDFLLITSIPNVFSPKFGVFDHRIVIVSGWHGAGTRAIDLLLRDPRRLAWLHRETSAFNYPAWQALISIRKLDSTGSFPLELGAEQKVFRIKGIDFARAHELVRGQCYWLDPDDPLIEL